MVNEVEELLDDLVGKALQIKNMIHMKVFDLKVIDGRWVLRRNGLETVRARFGAKEIAKTQDVDTDPISHCRDAVQFVTILARGSRQQ